MNMHKSNEKQKSNWFFLLPTIHLCYGRISTANEILIWTKPIPFDARHYL